MNNKGFQKVKELVLTLALVFGLFLPASSTQALPQKAEPTAQETSQGIPTDRIIIKYKDGSGSALSQASGATTVQMNSLSTAAGMHLEYARQMSNTSHVLQLDGRLPVDQVQAISDQLMTLPDVEYAEPDWIMQHTLVPNDPLYDTAPDTPPVDQWHYHDTWGINAPAAWDITTGSASTVVAVIDTGITLHEDLSLARQVPGYDFISDNMIANDEDLGRDNDPGDPGDWITVEENASGYFAGCPIDDSSWHGTHVAGTIGASSNNGVGVAGINWNAKILPVRVLGKCGGYTSDIVDGMRWAAGLTVSGVTTNPNPADVINLSLGGSHLCSATEQSAVTDIVNAGTVVVVAAGNSGLDASGFSPANCTGVITVAATDAQGIRADFSNYGSTVEIAAPGGGNGQGYIRSTWNDGTTTPTGVGTYVGMQGTSMAAPHVSGVVSLMFAANPLITPSQVLSILQKTARDFSPGGDTCDSVTPSKTCGSGLLDAAEAVRVADLPDLVITDVDLNPISPAPDQLFDVIVTVKNQGGSASGSGVYRNIYIDRDPSTTLVMDETFTEGGLLTSDPGDAADEVDPGDYFKQDFVNSIPAGGVVSESVSIRKETSPGVFVNGLPAGSHQIYAYTDANGIVEEGFENNNAYGQNLNFGGFPSGPTIIDVTIGPDYKGGYAMSPGQSTVQSYPGVTGGPVVIKSNNGVGIIASLLQYRRPGTTGGWTGVTQTMALTDAQISDVYVFPRYDYTDTTRYNSLQIANFDTIATNVTVEIGGVLKGTYPLGVGISQNVVYSGFVGGPVVVRSDNGADIVASLYELKRATTTSNWTGQTQMMGLPWTQLSDTYVIPRYIHHLQDLQPALVFANAGSQATEVSVTIGGVFQGSYPLSSGQSTVQSYPGLTGGPVVLQSNNGVSIIASLLQYRRPGTTGGWTGVTQTMALTDAQITDAYVFPRYDYTDTTRYNSLQIANFDTASTNVTVEIGGVLKGTYPLGVGISQNVVYSGFAGGPVVVRSDNGADIVASLYELKRATTTSNWTGQTQMMGLPWTQLSDTYVIPRYIHHLQDLQPALIFAVP